jgi:hypothetical protein
MTRAHQQQYQQGIQDTALSAGDRVNQNFETMLITPHQGQSLPFTAENSAKQVPPTYAYEIVEAMEASISLSIRHFPSSRGRDGGLVIH